MEEIKEKTENSLWYISKCWLVDFFVRQCCLFKMSTKIKFGDALEVTLYG